MEFWIILGLVAMVALFSDSIAYLLGLVLMTVVVIGLVLTSLIAFLLGFNAVAYLSLATLIAGGTIHWVFED